MDLSVALLSQGIESSPVHGPAGSQLLVAQAIMSTHDRPQIYQRETGAGSGGHLRVRLPFSSIGARWAGGIDPLFDPSTRSADRPSATRA